MQVPHGIKTDNRVELRKKILCYLFPYVDQERLSKTSESLVNVDVEKHFQILLDYAKTFQQVSGNCQIFVMAYQAENLNRDAVIHTFSSHYQYYLNIASATATMKVWDSLKSATDTMAIIANILNSI